MDKHIKEIWKRFKKREKEMFCLFYESDGDLYCEVISKNETATSGEIDLKKLADISQLIQGKSVYAVHNHPNDIPVPSVPDFFQKEQIEAFLILLNCKMEDYLIVSPYGYTSFKTNGFHRTQNSFLSAESDTIKQVDFPNIAVNSDIKKNKIQIASLLTEYAEAFFSEKRRFASNCFSGEFLLEQVSASGGKNIFFVNKNNPNFSLERLAAINLALEPFEIYMLDAMDLIPLKKHGFL